MDYHKKYLKFKTEYYALKVQLSDVDYSAIFKCFDNLTNNKKKSYLINTSPYAILKHLLTMTEYDKTTLCNILIGASNKTGLNDGSVDDYIRFTQIPKLLKPKFDIYNMYIDRDYDPSRQYNMFTLDWKILKLKLIEMNDDSRLQEYVDNMHFDRQVSYFTPIYYYYLAGLILKPQGKLVFTIEHHEIRTSYIRYADGTFKNYLDPHTHNKTQQELEDQYKIIIDNENKLVNLGGYFKNKPFDLFDNIVPLMPLSIRDTSNNYELYTTTFDMHFANWLNNIFDAFNIELKYYNYRSKHYPVAIRVIDWSNYSVKTHIPIIDYIVNNVMNNDERYIFIQDLLTDELLTSISAKILLNKTLIDDINKLASKNISCNSIHNYIDMIFSKPRPYIVATKIQPFIWQDVLKKR